MTDLIVHARIRNRLIEVLGWIVDARADVPACGFDELVNSWNDWAPIEVDDLPHQVFTPTEIAGIRSVGEAIEGFCAATPSSVPNTLEIVRLHEWIRVTAIAGQTLNEMIKRGKSFEGKELNA